MTTKRATRKIHRCGICGVPLRGERWMYSADGLTRLCHQADWNDCADRADKKVAR